MAKLNLYGTEIEIVESSKWVDVSKDELIAGPALPILIREAHTGKAALALMNPGGDVFIGPFMFQKMEDADAGNLQGRRPDHEPRVHQPPAGGGAAEKVVATAAARGACSPPALPALGREALIRVGSR